MNDKVFNIKIEDETVLIELLGAIGYYESNDILKEFENIKLSKNIKEVVFFMDKINNISSAGIRTLIYPKTKRFFGPKTKIFLINAKESVIHTLKLCGVDELFITRDKYVK
jgi:anti-anti-sigma factor